MSDRLHEVKDLIAENEALIARISVLPNLEIKGFNGHFNQGKRTPRLEYLRQILANDIRPFFGRNDIEALQEAISTGVPLEEPVRLGRAVGFQCPFCSKRMAFGFDGVSLHLMGDPCVLPDGIPSTEFELNVPSGKIAVDDDLRQWFPISQEPDLNTIQGQAEWTQAYAAVGLALGGVSNTCPSVRRNGKGKFVISTYSESSWDDEEKAEIPNPEPCPWGKVVANVCTDLWAYSICDADELQRRMDHYTPGETVGEWSKHWTHKIVRVKPGVYRFRHYHDVDYDQPNVKFAEFEWVRKPDPLVDYVGQEKPQTFTATECLIQNCINWPTLYMPSAGEGYENRLTWNQCSIEQKTAALALAADQVMCVLGGGVEWHENGHPRTAVSSEAQTWAKELAEELSLPEGEVPSFNALGSTYWYPISAGYGGLCLGSGVVKDESYMPKMAEPVVRLNRSFVLLGLNIAQQMIQRPVEAELNTDVWPPRFGKDHVRARMRLALMCYQGLRKHYPNLVFDQEFDSWIKAGQAELYIDGVDLGPDFPPEDKWPPKPEAFQLVEAGVKYVEFNAAKSEEGGFCWHPRNPGVSGCWASKKDAQRYALCTDNGAKGIEAWHTFAPVSVPLKFVARVTGASQQGHPVVIIEFDYGSDEMIGDAKKSWAIKEEELVACRFFNEDNEYQDLLTAMKRVYEKMENLIDKKLERK